MKIENKIITRFTLFLAVIAIGLAACTKKTDSPIPATTATGTLGFHFHTNVDDAEVDSLGQVYQLTIGDNAGRNIVVTQAQVLISNIQLTKADGSIYNIPGVIIHKVQAQEQYIVASVPVGNYTSVSYQIGLDTATNATVPVASNTALYDSTLWFANTATAVPSTGGYVFIDFEGKIDTSASKNGLSLTPFKYRIGTTAHAVRVSLPNTEPFSVTASSTQYVHMVINYAALLDGLTLNNPTNLSVASKADNNLPFVSTIVGNIKAGGSRPYFINFEY